MDFLRPLADNNFPADSDNTSGSAVTLGPWPPGAQGVMVWCTEAAYIIQHPDSSINTNSIYCIQHGYCALACQRTTSQHRWYCVR